MRRSLPQSRSSEEYASSMIYRPHHRRQNTQSSRIQASLFFTHRPAKKDNSLIDPLLGVDICLNINNKAVEIGGFSRVCSAPHGSQREDDAPRFGRGHARLGEGRLCQRSFARPSGGEGCLQVRKELAKQHRPQGRSRVAVLGASLPRNSLRSS